ncbi:hypothetical protein DFH08DRAFT_814825 [Mycena albidolilacea]|uniref:Uncharacterized protein n=1 Tax=Mycena albidolilacea TaxID=1033008 RepID=A0AAD6ZNV6_9AGAR|nr:hypothetical protein DFH08DRAFT_814825 [Mycena albidolilacea]
MDDLLGEFIKLHVGPHTVYLPLEDINWIHSNYSPMSPSSDSDDPFPTPPGLEAAWLKLVHHSKQFQESKNEGAGSHEGHLDTIAAAWVILVLSPLLLTETAPGSVPQVRAPRTRCSFETVHRPHGWGSQQSSPVESQLGSETATKDFPLPQEVENILGSGSSFLDKRHEYIKKTAAEAAKKEREIKREQALATKKAVPPSKETTLSGKHARSESVGPSDIESKDQIDTDIDMDPDEDFLGTPAWCMLCSKLLKHTVQSCPDQGSENGQGHGKSHRVPSHTDIESATNMPVKKKATRVRFQKKTGPAGPAVIVDSGSPVIAFSVTAGSAAVEQHEASASSNTLPAASFSFDDIGKMINSGDHVIKSIGTLAQTNEGLQHHNGITLYSSTPEDHCYNSHLQCTHCGQTLSAIWSVKLTIIYCQLWEFVLRLVQQPGALSQNRQYIQRALGNLYNFDFEHIFRCKPPTSFFGHYAILSRPTSTGPLV